MNVGLVHLLYFSIALFKLIYSNLTKGSIARKDCVSQVVQYSCECLVALICFVQQSLTRADEDIFICDFHLDLKEDLEDMRTEVVKVNPIHPEQPIIERAAALLRDGQVVVFPTETVYGLGADAFQPIAL